jgi:16S rRNA (cytidine1402-2'-O)-methyltransferase
MNVGKPAPGLHLVSTPIGAARDITLRALDILTNADLLAAEDTRNTKRLLDIHGVSLGDRRLISYHDHNAPRTRPVIMAALEAGKSVAYVSDAGTPMLADPGYDLCRVAIAAEIDVLAAPGASALLAALVVAGLPTDRFFFAGFAPNKTNARKKFYAELVNIKATLVFYESPKRIHGSLIDMVHSLGADRQVAVCRELTKKFEQVHRGTLGDVCEIYQSIENPRGEFVVVLGPPVAQDVDQGQIDAALIDALARLRVNEAAKEVADEFGISKKLIYKRALELK